MDGDDEGSRKTQFCLVWDGSDPSRSQHTPPPRMACTPLP